MDASLCNSGARWFSTRDSIVWRHRILSVAPRPLRVRVPFSHTLSLSRPSVRQSVIHVAAVSVVSFLSSSSSLSPLDFVLYTSTCQTTLSQSELLSFGSFTPLYHPPILYTLPCIRSPSRDPTPTTRPPISTFMIHPPSSHLSSTPCGLGSLVRRHYLPTKYSPSPSSPCTLLLTPYQAGQFYAWASSRLSSLSFGSQATVRGYSNGCRHIIHFAWRLALPSHKAPERVRPSWVQVALQCCESRLTVDG